METQIQKKISKEIKKMDVECIKVLGPKPKKETIPSLEMIIKSYIFYNDYAKKYILNESDMNTFTNIDTQVKFRFNELIGLQMHHVIETAQFHYGLNENNFFIEVKKYQSQNGNTLKNITQDNSKCKQKRNDKCNCGSGKKYKKCGGINQCHVSKGSETTINTTGKELKIVEALKSFCIEKGWVKACVLTSAILSETFTKYGIQNKIIKGYLLTDAPGKVKYACWHCWVETQNNKYDVTPMVLEQVYPEFANLNNKYKLCHEIPTGYERVDMDNDDELILLQKNEEIFNKYMNNPDEFWNNPFDENDKDMFEVALSGRDYMLNRSFQ